MIYRIGIDVGERSVGFASVEYDENGNPLKILSAVSHIHDGGKDPSTGKSPKSRLATAGVARRTRRLIRNRRKRLNALDKVLIKQGFPVPDVELSQTYEAWFARDVLSRVYVTNEKEKYELISLAVRHIARHRGWRNPWWSYQKLSEQTEATESWVKLKENAVVNHGSKCEKAETLGQLVALVAKPEMSVRPTNGAKNRPEGALMSTQIKQQDSFLELKKIFAVQKISADVSDEILKAVFFQTKPVIPKDRIGKCPLILDELRAPRAAIEFQEFRLREQIANLRLKDSKTGLSEEQYEKVFEMLWNWDKDDKPSWSDVADCLGIDKSNLVRPTVDDSDATNPVTNVTSRTILELKKKSQIYKWWIDADDSSKAEFVELITDLSGADFEIESPALANLLENADDDLLEEMDKLATKSLPSGRAAYSRKALQRLIEVMRTNRCNSFEARKVAFDVPDDWEPQRLRFQDGAEQPVVQRVNSLVARYLSTAIDKWGAPERIVVEHVRSAFLGPTALADFNFEIAQNTRRKAKASEELKAQGFTRTTNADIKRYELVQRQNSQCLYCGDTISMQTSELDHIVPRASGGSSKAENLVAVCRPCNGDKDKLPFSVWAERSNRPGVSLKEAQARTKTWTKGRLTDKQLNILVGRVNKRLALKADDEIDERSLESTAYAAREMRQRIESMITEKGWKDSTKVLVFSGAASSEARKAGGVDKRILLRGSDKKTRLDRRHHAIDAAVITTLTAKVTEVLNQRRNMQSDNRVTGSFPEWREFQGGTEHRFIYNKWLGQINELGNLLNAAIYEDKVAVVRPLRLTPEIGSVHADTIEKFEFKPVGEIWTASDLQRIVESRWRVALLDEENLNVEDHDRGIRLGLPDQIKLFPSNAAYIAVRNGAAKIGDTIQSARIYRWKTKTGFSYGMVRMYTGEFSKIGFLEKGVDIFTAPLPFDSQAMLTANPALVSKIASGEAEQIGWLTVGDEIEFDAGLLVGDDDSSIVGKFIQEYPERRWVISGFEDNLKINLRPAYLAAEGLDSEVSKEVSLIFNKSARLSCNKLLSVRGLVVVRRTVLGTVRWKGQGLPVSWKP